MVTETSPALRVSCMFRATTVLIVQQMENKEMKKSNALKLMLKVVNITIY